MTRKILVALSHAVLIIVAVLAIYYLSCVIKSDEINGIVELETIMPTFSETNELMFREEDSVSIYQMEVSLKRGDAFIVSFDLLGADKDGGMVCVDLYGQKYDNPESEFRYSVSESIFSVNRMLKYGRLHPKKCMLRIYSEGNTNAIVSNITIKRISHSFSNSANLFLLLILIFSVVPVIAYKKEIFDLVDEKRRYICFLILIVFFQILVFVFWGAQKSNFYVDELYSLGEATRYLGIGDQNIYLYEGWESDAVLVRTLRERLVIKDDQSLLEHSFINGGLALLRGHNYFGLLNIFYGLIGKGRVDYYSGIVLNVIIFVITQVFICRIMNLMGVDRENQLFGVWWYGYCGITVGNIVFVRFYTLEILLLTIVIYLHALIWTKDRTWDWVFAEAVTAMCLYFGCKNTKLFVPVIVAIVSSFSIGLIFDRKNRSLKNIVVYIVSMIGGGGAVLFKLYFINLVNYYKTVSHARETGGIAGDADRVEEVISTIKTITLSDFMRKISECINILKTQIFGNEIILLAIIIFFCAIISMNRRKINGNDRNAYLGFAWILLLAGAIYTIIMACSMNVIVRYYSFAGILIIISVVYLLDYYFHNFHFFWRDLLCILIVVGCISIHMDKNIDYVYPDDSNFHEMLLKYNKLDSLILMDIPSFQRSLYEAVVWMDDDAKLIKVRNLDGEPMIGEEKKGDRMESDQYLLWTFPDQNVSSYLLWLEENGYTYRVLGADSAAEVYYCLKDAVNEY